MVRGGRANRGGKRFHSSNGNKKNFKNKNGKRNASHFKPFNTQNQDAEEHLKKQRLLEMEKLERNRVPSSDSEEEAPDHMKQLLSTFKSSIENKKSAAIISSDDDSDLDVASSDALDSLTDSDSNSDDLSVDSDLSKEDLDAEASEADGVESDRSFDSDLTDENDKPKPKTNTKNIAINNRLSEHDMDDGGDNEDAEITNSEENTLSDSDPFCVHLDNELSPNLLNAVSKTPAVIRTYDVSWPILGRLNVEIPTPEQEVNAETKNKSETKKITLEEDIVYASAGKVPVQLHHDELDWEKLGLKMQLREHVGAANAEILKNCQENYTTLTPLQAELFSVMNGYQDLYYPERTLNNGEEVRLVYCLHALNHVLKTRTKVLHHNSKILHRKGDIPDQFRDQGLVRPKVLIVVPFRDSALRVVNMITSLLVPAGGGRVQNSLRLQEEYGGPGIAFPKKNPKPEDYEQLFHGNTDDKFRLGISITKKSVKLYADYYGSDIIVASPLGLRVAVGAPGEGHRDYDFLSSLELLILDQADVFLAQNWDHLLHVLDHVHLQPKETHGVDYSRVRTWCLNGLSKYYRQTLLFSSHALPEFRNLFNRRCHNYRGKVRVANPVGADRLKGCIRHVAVAVPQVFHRITCESVSDAIEARFKYFIQHLLPEYQAPGMAQCLLYIPSYFDYVRIRNYFKKEDISFVQICEYTADAKMARARDMFYHGASPLMLYSERVHFFRRSRIRGIRHLIMYQPPSFPDFYSEMCNFMQEANQNPRTGVDSNMTVTVMYTKYDSLQLASIVGSDRAAHMLQSKRNLHMFMTGDGN